MSSSLTRDILEAIGAKQKIRNSVKSTFNGVPDFSCVFKNCNYWKNVLMKLMSYFVFRMTGQPDKKIICVIDVAGNCKQNLVNGH
ncbi:hypothetical protein C6Y08_15065 [Lactiplantibacillus pentosus]|uniref:Transposase n=1 Tax=Lactiplantibacillus pentosus TaxID=1589 RepID=A0ABD7IL15_LACPE|nr:hypothetical protein C6Y08_15065 [Lactiplantibacillus pentosus]RMW42882.1 hypothetical protein D6U18_16235 [Lactiplantibacillus pentosus]